MRRAIEAMEIAGRREFLRVGSTDRALFIVHIATSPNRPPGRVPRDGVAGGYEAAREARPT